MQRLIKFRAWNGKKMYYGKELWLRDDQWWYGVAGYDTPPDKVFSGNKGTALMQFTGLKDKNGKEIYEGDIAKIKHRDYLGIIKMDERGYWISEGENKTENAVLNITSVEEIIGNIYENPELMN